MHSVPVAAIFDIGKTNKKFFLFDEQYQIIRERSMLLTETVDEDGDACENLPLLADWVQQTMKEMLAFQDVKIKAINFSTYGASLVHIDSAGKPLTPLYNYLKSFPLPLQARFYEKYGGQEDFTLTTASPALGSLNSGLQLYRLKYEQPEVFKNIRYSLHLPQYISYLFTSRACSDITSIGCHTGLWDFANDHYHKWVDEEDVHGKLAPVCGSNEVFKTILHDTELLSGVGLHDSSAALIPYLAAFSEPFILISTGTWCISLNPYNRDPLTSSELLQDCLCYKDYSGRPIKASRLFAGNEHGKQVKRLSEHFKIPAAQFAQLLFDASICKSLHTDHDGKEQAHGQFVFGERHLDDFPTYESAYYQLMADIVHQQKLSTSIVMNGQKSLRIFVDGGFAQNPVYMHLLAASFPEAEVFAASVSQASATGAALAIHSHWNERDIPRDMISLKYYCATM